MYRSFPTGTLPNCQYPPTACQQRSSDFAVPQAIARQFRLPELFVRRRHRSAGTPFVCVPKTSMYENYGTMFGEHHVWHSRECANVQSIAKARSKQQMTHQPLWRRIFGSDPRHNVAALSFIKLVQGTSQTSCPSILPNGQLF